MRLKTFVGVALMSYAITSMAALEIDNKQLSYSLGVRLAEQVKALEGIDPDALSEGIRDVLSNAELKVTPEDIEEYIEIAFSRKNQLHQQPLDQVASDNLQKGEAFLIDNSSKPGVVTLKSGLQYRILKEGRGSKATESDYVVVHYEGRLLDGNVFVSSYNRTEPTIFQVNQIISGLTEAIQEMPEGSVWELFIPSSLAYGAKGIADKVGPNEVLTFKVELQQIKK